MNTEEYISSGILELYVYGVLSDAENKEITDYLRQYPEIRTEVEEIEKALIDLSGAIAPENPEHLLQSIKEKLSKRTDVMPLSKKRTHWFVYAGWAASVLLLIGLFFLFDKNRALKETLDDVRNRNIQLEIQITEARNNAEKTQKLLDVLRNRNILKVPLQGQQAAPDAYAAVYWDKEKNITYIDAKGLPAPPEGMVYQIWSLKMQPLTPTSIGLLDAYDTDENKIFKLENTNVSEGFGITLEPEGGSKTPTLERLYTLGVVQS
ncbi:anti-sigma factor [Sinomicrobium kalidii]|uniref:anti-sigma factor n=1 Tax=Sinomicrobium kalidii TaxID=2900738 RepID=UPI001E2E473D|nr:anti-sigma factor [Sinomicrobium kalidii]UGU15132.1 anti-sigma factor [Sinomicrobium kalidii]